MIYLYYILLLGINFVILSKIIVPVLLGIYNLLVYIMTRKNFLKLHRRNLTIHYFRRCAFIIGLMHIFTLSFFMTSCNTTQPVDKQLKSATPTPSFNADIDSILFPLTTTPYPPIFQSKSAITVETSFYTHPRGHFSFQLPRNWLIFEENDRVIISAPQGDPRILILVLNTGYSLDATSLSVFIETQELKKASRSKNYIEIDRQKVTGENALLVTSEYIEDGKLKRTVSFYKCIDNMLFIADFQVFENNFDLYDDFFESLISSININMGKVLTLPVYSFDRAVLRSNGYFSILVPDYWSSRQHKAEHTLVETFTSPDQNAVIQTVVYDDGKHMSTIIAGEIALALLRNNYTKRITISSDVVLIDGREQLTWISRSDGYHGITSFDVQGTSLLTLTIIWNNDPDQIYEKLLEQVFLSYELVDP
jgi:hypothetical protein